MKSLIINWLQKAPALLAARSFFYCAGRVFRQQRSDGDGDENITLFLVNGRGRNSSFPAPPRTDPGVREPDWHVVSMLHNLEKLVTCSV